MQLHDFLALKKIQGIGNKTLVALIEFCSERKIESLSHLQSVDLSNFQHLKRASTALNNFFSRTSFQETLKQCKTEVDDWELLGVKAVLYGSSNYPKQLIELQDPPAILFCKGNLELLKTLRSIAVVGTRENSHLGEVITQKTVEHFSKTGFCIVSGLALGIDTIAHRTTLECKGTTVAVLVDVVNIAPSQNRLLAEQIVLAGGLLISENSPNTSIVPAFFAKRDRIQAGLAMAVFAIETSEDGGTMHAVNTAVSINRPIYVPDVIAARYQNLNERTIQGTQMLVRKGIAESYSRDSYDKITKKLTELAENYNDSLPKSGNLL